MELTADAYLVCLAHALTTEKEEVMGLLLGEVSPPPNGRVDRRTVGRKKERDRGEGRGVGNRAGGGKGGGKEGE